MVSERRMNSFILFRDRLESRRIGWRPRRFSVIMRDRLMQKLMEYLIRQPERNVVVFSLALLLAGNWIMPLTDRDEVRFAEASREMIQRGDYVVPWFNGAYRFDKPILIYWCQSTSYRIFGVNDFAARFPSVLFTTGTALILVRWGRRLADARTGFFAGVMFVAGLHIAVMGRAATADMALIFFYTLTVWSGWEWTRPGQPHRIRWWWIFFVGFALTFLAKGPEGYLPLVGLVICRWLHRADFELRPVPTLAGFLLSLGLIGLWGIPALMQTQGKYLNVGIGEHVIHRAVSVNDSHGLKGYGGFLLSLPVYFVTFFGSFFPWSIRMPAAISRWWPKRGGDVVGSYLMVQALVVFTVFSLVHTKLLHYTLPAFPCIALWLALQLAPRKNETVWLGKCMAGMALFIAIVMFGFFSVAKYHFLTENLWRATRAYVRPETKVGCFGFTESSLVWRFRTVSTNLVTLGPEKDAADFLTNPPPFILVVPTRDMTNFPDTNDLQVQVNGLDIVRLRHWDLTAIVRP